MRRKRDRVLLITTIQHDGKGYVFGAFTSYFVAIVKARRELGKVVEVSLLKDYRKTPFYWKVRDHPTIDRLFGVWYSVNEALPEHQYLGKRL